jgi:hypothetical protein
VLGKADSVDTEAKELAFGSTLDAGRLAPWTDFQLLVANVLLVCVSDSVSAALTVALAVDPRLGEMT